MSILKTIYFIPWGGLGDVLLATPALEAIKQRYPEALIYCQASSFYWKLLATNPHIHQHVITSRGLLETPEDKLSDITNKLNGSEVVFYPNYGHLRPSLMADQVHAIDIICNMIQVTPVERRVRVYLSTEDEAYAEDFVRRIGQPLIAFHPHATCSPGKMWYPKRWERVIGWIIDKGYKVVQLGYENETPVPGIINLLGKTSIRQALAIVKRAKYFLGIDSVFNHAAHSFGIRGVVLFGASTPKIWGYEENINIYKGLKCQPCIDLLYDKCQARRCMQQITVDEVIEALESVMG